LIAHNPGGLCWLLTFQQIGTHPHHVTLGDRLELCKAGAKFRNERSISTKRILLGDIGATNARFALLADGQVGPVKSLDVAGFLDLPMRRLRF
jgi:hypothetical protein